MQRKAPAAESNPKNNVIYSKYLQEQETRTKTRNKAYLCKRGDFLPFELEVHATQVVQVAKQVPVNSLINSEAIAAVDLCECTTL